MTERDIKKEYRLMKDSNLEIIWRNYEVEKSRIEEMISHIMKSGMGADELTAYIQIRNCLEKLIEDVREIRHEKFMNDEE